jgi:hypothetical protein
MRETVEFVENHTVKLAVLKAVRRRVTRAAWSPRGPFLSVARGDIGKPFVPDMARIEAC